MSLTDEQKHIIKSTSSLLKENGKEITSIFYKHLFEDHPELLNFFNHTNQKCGTQPLALANIIYFAAENIDRLETLRPQIDIIAHKHRAVTIKPEHYPIVGKYMLRAIDEHLGEQSTPEILGAWSNAYAIIANCLIETEKKLYDALGCREDDKDFIPFTIVSKEQIAKEPIYSIGIKRSDGRKLFEYQPGQYITLRLKINGMFHNRHYGLVRPFAGQIYRLAIRQIDDCEPKGIFTTELINNYHIGDTILASLPAGCFPIVEKATHHLFIAGGVGISVISTLIESLYNQGKSSSVTLIHCVSSTEHAAFTERMKLYVPDKQFYLVSQGRKALKEIIQKVVTKDTEAYLCGPVDFMKTVENYLEECHVPSSHVHLNSFRPELSLLKNAAQDRSITKSL